MGGKKTYALVAATLALVLAVSVSRVLAAGGSNQGSYGTNFAPAVLRGQVFVFDKNLLFDGVSIRKTV